MASSCGQADSDLGSKSTTSVAQTWRVTRSAPPGAPKPLDAAALDRLALGYAGRYATTRAKLRDYLKRKLSARGWDGEEAPPVEALVERMAALGYVDDRAFAEARASALGRRGYGVRRVSQALRGAGISEEDAAPVRERAAEQPLAAALAYARRRRIGPYAVVRPDNDTERRALAAMVRAGHSFAIARRIASARPGEEIVPDGIDGD